MPSCVSVSLRESRDSIFHTDNQGQDTAEGSPRVSCCTLGERGCSSALLITVWCGGLKHKERKLKKCGVVLRVRGRAVFSIENPTAHGTLGDAPSWEEAQFRWGKESRAWEQTCHRRMTDQATETRETPSVLSARGH